MRVATQQTVRTLAVCLVLVSGVANAGWFSKKKAPPPPPEPPPVVVPVVPPPPPPPIPLEFSGVQTADPLPAPLDRVKSASPEVQTTLQWIADSKDNAGLPFIVVDKANAQVYEFTPFAQLKATAPILLGGGHGDTVLVSPDDPMSAIPEQKRITPAGRYLSYLVTDVHGKVILNIDGKNLISLHVVAKGTPAQRRAERLASVTSDDNRISFGCINVPPGFFTNIVSPDFGPRKGVVYILPEKTTAAQWFGFQPPTTGAIALQTALGSTEGAAPAAAVQAAVQAAVAQPSPATQASAANVPASASLNLAPPAPAPVTVDLAPADPAPVAQ
jgi:hypothetical protein